MLIAIKFMHVIESKISKIHPSKISNRGARARCAGAGYAFDYILNEAAKTAAGVARSRSLPNHAL